MKKVGNTRWVICGLLFALVALSYIDRLIIGILKNPIGEKLGWSDADYGYVASGFSFGYAFGYLFAGRAMDRLRVKRGLPMFFCVWCLAVASRYFISFIGKDEVMRLHYPWFSWTEKGFQWMTLVMPMTAFGFVSARAVLGLAEGANFPSAIRTVAEWFPVKERAFATGIVQCQATNVGAVLCPIAVPWIYKRIGWPPTFYLTGAMGFLWLIGWWFLYDEPEKHRLLTPEELAYIRSGQPPVAPQYPAARPLARLARLPAGLGVSFCQHSRRAGVGLLSIFRSGFSAKTFWLEPAGNRLVDGRLLCPHGDWRNLRRLAGGSLAQPWLDPELSPENFPAALCCGGGSGVHCAIRWNRSARRADRRPRAGTRAPRAGPRISTASFPTRCPKRPSVRSSDWVGSLLISRVVLSMALRESSIKKRAATFTCSLTSRACTCSRSSFCNS